MLEIEVADSEVATDDELVTIEFEDVRDAQAALRPCELYAHNTSPIPSRTHGHHRYPVYLQNRVYGRIVIPDLMWLCGLCHDSVHDWISWILGEARKPIIEPGRNAKIEANKAVKWYRGAVAQKIAAETRTMIS